jgi:hypothetical protein
VFFCSEIQATDSTCTGCSAKRSAASHSAREGLRLRAKEPAKDEREEHGRGGVEEHGDDVVARGVVAPELVLHPECAVKERIVLLGRPDAGPDPQEAADRAQCGRGHVVAVVPDEAAPERGQVREERREKTSEAGARVQGFADRGAAFGTRYEKQIPPRAATA